MKQSYVRNLTKTLAVLTLLAPASAYPLGIGSIKLHSALNQNLNAEIPLLLTPGEKVSDIKINLAPPSKFDEAGIPWSYFLSQINFETIERSDGLVVIRLSSKEALKEPFLGLLLEVSWPKGSLYREFSLLVDPPEVYEQATVPVIALPENNSPQFDFTPPESLPETNSPRFNFTPSETSDTPRQRKKKPRLTPSNTYGPTQKSDTLWKISERAGKQRNVSLVQMMMSIFQRNPDAFFTENINALRSGKILKIPQREAVLKLSRNQALAEYERQTAAWKNRNKAGSVEKTPDTKNPLGKDQATENQLILAAPSEESVVDNAVITPGQEQTKTAGNAKNAVLASKDAAQTNISEKTPGYDVLQNQIIALQQQLSKMQEILAIKDQQLAALQDQINARPATTTQPAAAPSTGAEEKAAPVKVPGPSSQPVKLKTTGSSARQANTNPESEQESDSYYLPIGAAVLIILSVLGGIWWRKRQIDSTMDDTESHFAPAEDYHPMEQPLAHVARINAPLDENNVFQVGPVGDESSFLSEFTPGDFEAFDNDEAEIDPVSEADVYLAYGRYQQAEDLMRQALVDQPDRDDCKLKLLEIFNAVENKRAFQAYAEELAASGKQSDPLFWAKVTEMGSEICPDSPLFSTTKDTPVASATEDAGKTPVNLAKNENKLGDFSKSEPADFGTDSFDDFLQKKKTASPETSLTETDYELNDEPQNNQEIEFDLSAFAQDAVESNRLDGDLPEVLTGPEKSDIGYDFETFDFDLNSDNSQQPNLDDTDLTGSKTDEEIALEEGFSLDKDFNFDFDLSEAEEQDSDQPDILGVSDLTDMDELETKLDLARAYLDMGDEVSAKDITEEVLERGSEEQKKAALKLIGNIR
ncbi:MAG: FimV/HubP family polar landmark protein [Gammaproteobacteria bacterium]